MGFTIPGAAIGLQAALGVGQVIGGMLMPKPEIPEVDIPNEIFQNMSDAEYWSYVGMPEAQRQSYLDNIQSNASMALNSSSSRRGGLGVVADINRNSNQAVREMVSLDSQMRMKNLETLYNARSQVAEADLNKQAVSRENAMFKLQQRNEMIGAGVQNVMGALGTTGSLSAMFGEDGGSGGLGKSRVSTTGKTVVKPISNAFNNMMQSKFTPNF